MPNSLPACRDTDPKRVYYLSMEFLMGRSLTNALNALDLVEPYHKALRDMGYAGPRCHHPSLDCNPTARNHWCTKRSRGGSRRSGSLSSGACRLQAQRSRAGTRAFTATLPQGCLTWGTGGPNSST